MSEEARAAEDAYVAVIDNVGCRWNDSNTVRWLTWVLLSLFLCCSKLKKHEPKEKKKLKFMQKYYHKGAFYVDDDSIRSKDDVRKLDATEATLEDKFDKEMLPAVMQVKNFGRAGR